MKQHEDSHMLFKLEYRFKEGWCTTKRCAMPMDTCFRKIRFREHPLQVTEEIFVYERQETEGVVLLYESTRGACYMPMCYNELGECGNMALIAAIPVSVYSSGNLVYADRYFCQSGCG